MKVLFCTPTASTSGIAKCAGYLMDYFTANPSAGLNIELFPMDSIKYLGENAPLYKRIPLGIRAYTKVILRLRQTLKISRPDIVHINSSASLGLIRDYIILRICKKSGIKICLHFHFGRIPEICRLNNWEWKMLKLIALKSDKIIVMNDTCYDSLSTLGLKNIYNIPNPLSPKVIDIANRANNELNIDNAIFVGHVLPTKGIYELFEAVSHFDKLRLFIIGQDPLGILPQLKKEYPDLFSQGRVHMSGHIPQNEAIAMMKKGMFVFPSHTEGFPNVILESMACGSPIIASSVGSIPEMLDVNSKFPCGICVPPKDSKALINAIEWVYGNRESAFEMGVRAKKRVFDKYNINIVAKQLVGVWYSAVYNTAE